MYRPDKDHPEGWIHRDKLAKIESEELQAAGINLSNARVRNQSKSKNEISIRENDVTGDAKRQRLHSPIEDDTEHDEDENENGSGLPTWDCRLPEEIEAEQHAASQMYANPILRKSGSRIPVLSSSPLPVPAERYERDTPIVRKRAASGTMSFEADLSVTKTRGSTHSKLADDSDTNSSAINQGSPDKQRSKSATMSSNSSAKPVTSAIRKASAPPRATPSPTQRPGTRSGEQDRPRTAVNKPEGDPPWLATMYKPDPMLPPDQQLIPTLAKKQMQAQWAENGNVPTTYDRDFTPIAVQSDQDVAKDVKRRSLLQAPVVEEPQSDLSFDPNSLALKSISSITATNGRPGTSGRITGAYSTMPKVVSPQSRVPSTLGSPVTTPAANPNSHSYSAPPPVSAMSSKSVAPQSRIQTQSLADDDEKAKKGCTCCIVM